jgi:hypothetical protein
LNWNDVREAALQLIRREPALASEPAHGLDAYVLNTTYEAAERPQADLGDFVYVLVRSLNNVGGGALPHGTAEMLRRAVRAIARDHASVDARMDALAAACLVALDGGVQLGDQHERYRRELAGRLDGTAPAGSKILQNVRAVALALERLPSAPGGRVPAFFAGLGDARESPTDACRFAERRLRELSAWDLRGMGLAVAANFLKDASAPLLAGVPRSELPSRAAAWFLKPDRHAIRVLTILVHPLATEQDVLALTSASDAALCRLLPIQSAPEDDPRWAAISTGWRIAIANDIGGIEVDRIAYLIGSGKYSRVVPGGRRTFQVGDGVAERYLHLWRFVRERGPIDLA